MSDGIKRRTDRCEGGGARPATAPLSLTAPHQGTDRVENTPPRSEAVPRERCAVQLPPRPHLGALTSKALAERLPQLDLSDESRAWLRGTPPPRLRTRLRVLYELTRRELLAGGGTVPAGADVRIVVGRVDWDIDLERLAGRIALYGCDNTLHLSGSGPAFAHLAERVEALLEVGA